MSTVIPCLAPSQSTSESSPLPRHPQLGTASFTYTRLLFNFLTCYAYISHPLPPPLHELILILDNTVTSKQRRFSSTSFVNCACPYYHFHAKPIQQYPRFVSRPTITTSLEQSWQIQFQLLIHFKYVFLFSKIFTVVDCHVASMDFGGSSQERITSQLVPRVLLTPTTSGLIPLTAT